ncbi:MAG: hypothetical protein MR030_01905 [Bacteroidales bacterium]|nr:hypothetical protein [Bacteroidales bacterium]
MGQCPECPGIYRGTVGQTTPSRKVGKCAVSPDTEEVSPSKKVGDFQP